MKTEYTTLKETILNNNCPECFSTNSIELSFKQKRIINRFVSNNSKTIIENLHCKKCETQIFRGEWTMDIEQVYSYHKKTLLPRSSNMQLTRLSYLILASIILGMLCASFILLQL